MAHPGSALMLDTPTLSSSRWLILIGALVAIIYLCTRTASTPLQLSTWQGEAASEPAALTTAPQIISADAVAQTGRGMAAADSDVPTGDPVDAAHIVMTQGYGVGTHAPAAIWGAVDLAVGTSSGQADIQNSLG